MKTFYQAGDGEDGGTRFKRRQATHGCKRPNAELRGENCGGDPPAVAWPADYDDDDDQAAVQICKSIPSKIQKYQDDYSLIYHIRLIAASWLYIDCSTVTQNLRVWI